MIVRCLVLCGIVCALTGMVLAGSAQAQVRRVVVSDADSVRVLSRTELVTSVESDASRDSLLAEIRRYTAMLGSMRDSLDGSEFDISLSDGQKEMIRDNIEEISEVVDRIATEVSRLEFEIKDNTISLLNEAGEGVVINIPENIDEHISEGFEVLSQMILSDLPDSVEFEGGQGWDWTNFIPEPPPPPRKTVQGNIIKVGDDLHILAKEDIRGNVVVVFGNAEVSGRVDGNVVALFGNLLLDETAEVTGKIISVGGGLSQDPRAVAHDVISVDLWNGLDGSDPWNLFETGMTGLLMRQGTFLLTVVLAVISMLAVPRSRITAIMANLNESPAEVLGLGLVGAFLGVLSAAVLIVVLSLTVIGIPLALLVFLAVLVAVVLAVGVCGATLGGRVCDRFGLACGSPWLAAVVGMTALHLVSFLGNLLSLFGSLGILALLVTLAGFAIKALAFFLGLGAIIRSRLGARHPA